MSFAGSGRAPGMISTRSGRPHGIVTNRATRWSCTTGAWQLDPRAQPAAGGGDTDGVTAQATAKMAATGNRSLTWRIPAGGSQAGRRQSGSAFACLYPTISDFPPATPHTTCERAAARNEQGGGCVRFGEHVNAGRFRHRRRQRPMAGPCPQPGVAKVNRTRSHGLLFCTEGCEKSASW